MAREIKNNQNIFAIKLNGCDEASPTKSPLTSKKLAGKTEELHYKNAQIASYFHNAHPSIIKGH